MIVTVLGASGRTGSYVASHLFAAQHQVFGGVRRAESADGVQALAVRSHNTAGPGVRPVVVDLLGPVDELRDRLGRSEVVVNATGTTDPRMGGPRVDREGTINAVRAAEAAGVRRFLQISAMYADRPEDGPETLREVLQAKRDGDEAVQASGMDWTIVRPGRLVDETLTGQISLARSLPDGGAIPREDVAALVATCLIWPPTVGLAFDVVSGTTPILEALAQFAPLPGENPDEPADAVGA